MENYSQNITLNEKEKEAIKRKFPENKKKFMFQEIIENPVLNIKITPEVSLKPDKDFYVIELYNKHIKENWLYQRRKLLSDLNNYLEKNLEKVYDKKIIEVTPDNRIVIVRYIKDLIDYKYDTGFYKDKREIYYIQDLLNLIKQEKNLFFSLGSINKKIKNIFDDINSEYSINNIRENEDIEQVDVFGSKTDMKIFLNKHFLKHCYITVTDIHFQKPTFTNCGDTSIVYATLVGYRSKDILKVLIDKINFDLNIYIV